MKDDQIKDEKKLKEAGADKNENKGRENIEPLNKKESMEERAQREGWTDIAESHLGIDE